ncbi:MAG: hypothetical protein KTR26_04205, partial [Flammeovirgaceae bacterium]|nr:hypothetical protein [Flammeovirgaceae bacterium]
MEKLEQISEKLFVLLEVEQGIDILSIDGELKEINIKDLIILMLKRYIKRSFESFMFASKNYWSFLSYEDWKEIVFKIKDDSLALYSFYPFM